jgi:superkiller protein 3
MGLDLTNWDNDLPPEPDEEYKALVRTLHLTEGFSLLFIHCSPVKGEELISRVKLDVFQKNIDVLRLHESTDNLYEIIECLPKRERINILFITGIEKSFFEYIKPGYGGQGNFYKEDSVPRVLGHLNLQRERFRDNFNICFIFLLRKFGLKYFIHRAADFYDWRSGVFEFGEEKVPVTIDIETKLYQQLEYLATDNLNPISAVATQALAFYLAHREVADEK